MSDKPARCFIDGIDWQHELRQARKGARLFPSVEALEEASRHTLEECGIVEVEVTLVRWVKKQDLYRNMKK